MTIHKNDTKRLNLSGFSAQNGELFLIHALLTWRIMSLITVRLRGTQAERKESGPYDVLDKLRELVGYQAIGKQTNEIGKALTCIYCSSFWIGLIVALLTGHNLGYGLALSTAAVMIEKYQFGG